MKAYLRPKLLATAVLLSAMTGPAYAEDQSERCKHADEEYQRMESTILPLQAMLWDELDKARASKDLAAVGKILTLINKSRKIRKDHGKDHKEISKSFRCPEPD